MDSQYQIDDRLIDIVDDAWRLDKLPHEDIIVAAAELPDPEADNGDTHLTLKDQERKWGDLALWALGDTQAQQ